MATPLVAIGIAAILLIASLLLALHNERAAQQDKMRELDVRARILASTVAAPLAFDDLVATGQYVHTMRKDPQIRAAGAFDENGRLVAGFGPLPRTNRIDPPRTAGTDLVVTAPVSEGDVRLGSIYLRASTEGRGQRMGRYIGIAAVIVMASVMVVVWGIAYGSLREAHRQLKMEEEARRNAEERLIQSQKMEAMGQLTGGVAHDFNNLLMIASGGLDLMERTDDPEKLDRLRKGIREAIDRGARLTQQLLTFARRSPLKPQVLDLGAHVAGLREMLNQSLREDIAVSVRIAGHSLLVEVDPSQLDVAILNIAINARDAMPSGGELTVGVEDAADDPDSGRAMVRLWLRDTGTGVPPGLIPKMIEPFFSTKGVGKGTGLGLSQVYGFARSSGGDIAIESTEGKGTTVSILLPRSFKSLDAASSKRTDPPPPTARRHILVVEDDPAVADAVCGMLRELGHSVDHVTTADEALTRLDRPHAYDAVFSDMVMPGRMNGLDLAKTLRTRCPDVPVLLTTGYSEAAAMAANENIELLPKPYSIEALATGIRKSTERK